MKTIFYLITQLFLCLLFNGQSYLLSANNSSSAFSLSNANELVKDSENFSTPDISLINNIPCLKLIIEDTKIDPEFKAYMLDVNQELKSIRVKAFANLESTLPEGFSAYRRNTKLLDLFHNEEVTEVVKNFEPINYSFYASDDIILSIEDQQIRFFEDLIFAIDNPNGLLSYLNLDPNLTLIKCKIYEKIIHAPQDLRTDKEIIDIVLFDYLESYTNATIDNIIVPTHPDVVENFVDNIADLNPNFLIPFQGTSINPNASIPFLIEYVDVDLTPLPDDFDDGFFKNPYFITNEPNKVLTKIKHDFDGQPQTSPVDPSHIDGIVKEVEKLNVLKNNNLPVIEVFGVTNHRGYPSLISKFYENGSLKPDQTQELFGSNILINKENLVDNAVIDQFVLMQSKLQNESIDIDDIQFLVDGDKNIFINDPYSVELNVVDIGAIQQINQLIFEIISKKIKSYSNNPLTANEIVFDVLGSTNYQGLVNTYLNEGLNYMFTGTNTFAITQNGDKYILNF